MQVSKIKLPDPNYPADLREISAPPKALYVLGNLPNSEAPTVSIVGSRRPTEYGRRVTYALASELAKAGVVIVSGLAIGLDAVAHRAAVEAGGRTVAVLGCGIECIYPTSNRGLALQILRQNGAIISEYPGKTEAFKSNFPARNRIIAGLSQATIVTEADAESGSLITANLAGNQGRQVMAVPGSIYNLRSAGPNNLLKTGAMPITSYTEVLDFLDIEGYKRQPVKAASKEEALVLELLGQGVNTSQELIDQAGLSAAQFANIITLMEITGKVRNLGAGQWVSR